jgi:hypothetical protein
VNVAYPRGVNVGANGAYSPATGPPPQIRAAGALVGGEGLLAIGVAVALLVRGFAVGITGAVAGEAGYFVLFGLGLAAVGVGLLRGRRWARTPAIVIQLLLLPVVYSLLGPSRELLLGAVSGVYVLATFLLLLNERSRRWWMDLPASSDQEPESGR